VGGNQLVVTGGNVKAANAIYWGSASQLSTDQEGSIELGNSTVSGKTPFIDFHYGTGSSQDYNVRIINDANGRLTVNATDFYVNGNIKSSTGTAVYRQSTGCASGGALSTNATCQTICCVYDEYNSCYGYYNCSGSCQYYVYSPSTCTNTILGKLISP